MVHLSSSKICNPVLPQMSNCVSSHQPVLLLNQAHLFLILHRFKNFPLVLMSFTVLPPHWYTLTLLSVTGKQSLHPFPKMHQSCSRYTSSLLWFQRKSHKLPMASTGSVSFFLSADFINPVKIISDFVWFPTFTSKYVCVHSFVYSFILTFIHSYIHSFSHSFIHSIILSYSLFLHLFLRLSGK